MKDNYKAYFTNEILFIITNLSLTKGEMHFTPPVQTVYATKQAIQEYFEEGEQAKWARHQRIWEALHKGLAQLGFKDVIKKDIQSKLVICVKYPNDPNWSFEKVHDYERGFTIYPDKVSDLPTFRVYCLGVIDAPDIEDFFEVLIITNMFC